MSWIKKLFNKKDETPKKPRLAEGLSDKQIEQKCYDLWAQSEGTWGHYLAARRLEKILKEENSK